MKLKDRPLSYVAPTPDWLDANWSKLEALCNIDAMRWSYENYAADLPRKWDVSRIAMSGDDVVGYSIGSVVGRYLWVHRLVVGEAERGRAIGRQILTHCDSVASSNRLNGILLKTQLTNEGAIRFYEREGFSRLPDLNGHAVFRRDLEPSFKVGVHQPNYVPWLGYFYKIFLSDAFVFLDDVPVPKGSYTVRTKVLINGEGKWLTVPSSRSLADEVQHSFPAGRDWESKHIKTLEACYARAPYFKQHFHGLAQVIERHRESSLADLNIALIQKILGILEIRRLFYRSNQLAVASSADERLVEIVRLLKGTEYVSGSGGANYQSEATFNRHNVGLKYSNFKPLQYRQRGDQFVPGLSVLDALFNIGAEGILEMFRAQAKAGEPPH